MALKPDKPIAAIFCREGRPFDEFVEGEAVRQVRRHAAIERAMFAIGEQINSDEIVTGHGICLCFVLLQFMPELGPTVKPWDDSKWSPGVQCGGVIAWLDRATHLGISPRAHCDLK